MKRKLLLFFSVLFISGSLLAQRLEYDNSYITGTGFNGEVNSIELDSNGKLLVGGNFTDYNGSPVSYLVRLNTDGTLDGTFSPTLSSSVDDLTVHYDNSVTVISAGVLKRFDATGAEIGSGTFDPASANNVIITVLAEASSHKVIIGGAFSDIGGRIARLNEDGSVDTAFANHIGTGFNGYVRALDTTSTGKILAGGDFSSFNSVTRNKIAVLNRDGTLDTGFDPSLSINPFTINVYSVAVQDDDKLLIGTYDGFTSPRLSRLNSDGTEDFYMTTGSPGTFIMDIYTKGTEKIILGGWFAPGIIEADYSTGFPNFIASGNIEGSSEEVNSIAVQSDGSIILGGDFTTFNGISANNIVRIATCGATIDDQPNYATICENSDTSFTVSASGSGILSYQWQLNTNDGVGLYTDITDGGVYSNATTNSLSITSAPIGMDGYYYRCIVTDDNCSSTTYPASLSVQETQVITEDPENDTTCIGGSANFSISYTGTPGGWQWQVDNGTGAFTDITSGNYTGYNHSTLTVNNITSDMDGYKYRLVSTLCDIGMVTISATLTVTSPPEITSSRKDQSVCESGDAIFMVETAEEGTLTYQWQYRTPAGTYSDLTEGGVYNGTDTAILTITGADNSLAELYDSDNSDGLTYATYRCIVSDNGCESISEASILWIYDSPAITSQPVNVDECDDGSGITAEFSVTSSITSGMTYQWQVDDGSGFTDIIDDEIYSGSTTGTLSITGATSALDTYKYRCMVGNCSTPVISEAAVLNITDKPVISNISANIERICEGSDVTFSFDDSGSGSTYQWEEYSSGSWNIINDDAMFSGTTSNSLVILSVPFSKDGVKYRCTITDGPCSVTTQQFTLDVYETPSFSTVQDKEICENTATTISVTQPVNFNSLVHTYQWQEEVADGVFNDISNNDTYNNAQTNNLHIFKATPEMNGKRFVLKVLGCVDDVVTDTILLTVNDSTRIISQPESEIIVCEKSDTAFEIMATGDNLSYIWYSNGTVITGQNNDRLVLSNIPASYDGSLYYSVVNGTCGSGVTSEEGLLTVWPETSISNGTTNINVCEDTDTAFTAVATGHNLAYLWKANGNYISDNSTYSGTNSEKLQITGITSDMDDYYYECEVSGTCGDNVTRVLGTINIAGITTKPVIYADLSVSESPRLYTDYSGNIHNWYKDGSLLQTNYGNLNISEDGSYTVTIEENTFGCLSPESDPYLYSSLGINNSFIADNISIFPNPAKDVLNFESNNLKINYISVLDISGRSIMTLKVDKDSLYRLNIEELPTGIYVLKIQTESGIGIKQFIKN